MTLSTAGNIVIVGAGCFGLSTAYHLLKRGFTRITVLDRSEVLPAPDAASVDINRIVRSSYADTFYANLARQAIEAWKDRDEWGDAYHESGVLVFLSEGGTEMDQAYANDVKLGARVESLRDVEAIRAIFPPRVKIGTFKNCSAYLNRDGGWVNASQATALMMSKVRSLGGHILPGKSVTSLVQLNGKTTGVECADGTAYNADLVVLAVGSWTASAFPSMGLEARCIATAQSNAFVQLSPEETETYRNCPVYLDLITGFCSFPPNEDGIVKSVLHSAGYTHSVKPPLGTTPVSTPHHVDGVHGSLVPREPLKVLREGLANVYPVLAEKSFCGTRMCWYTDSPDDDWIIGFHPSRENVLIATAGSGHAYKFLPVLGSIVVDVIQGSLDPQIARKFAVDRQMNKQKAPRYGGLRVRELDLKELCGPDDLLMR